METLTVKTFTPDHEVIADGVVIIPSDSYVEFLIQNLKYRLSFTNDGEERVHYSASVKEKDTSNAYMDIVFYNVPSLLFTTPSNVIELGTMEGKKLCLRFSLSTIQRGNISDYVLMYNWLMEK
jgi:hypothetical protein